MYLDGAGLRLRPVHRQDLTPNWHLTIMIARAIQRHPSQARRIAAGFCLYNVQLDGCDSEQGCNLKGGQFAKLSAVDTADASYLNPGIQVPQLAGFN